MPYPYPSTADIPEYIRNVLPPRAQEIFQKVFRNAWNRYPAETTAERLETAHKIAWSAVKKSYEKNEDGKWIAKRKS